MVCTRVQYPTVNYVGYRVVTTAKATFNEVRRANETLSKTPEESLDSASEKQSQDTAAQKSSPKEN